MLFPWCLQWRLSFVGPVLSVCLSVLWFHGPWSRKIESELMMIITMMKTILCTVYRPTILRGYLIANSFAMTERCQIAIAMGDIERICQNLFCSTRWPGKRQSSHYKQSLAMSRCLWRWNIIQGGPITGSRKLLSISSPNIDRFSKIFTGTFF